MRVHAFVLIAAMSPGLALAQIAPPPAQPPAPPPAQPDPMSGPKVTEPKREPTLIHQSMETGMIMRLETSPEEAALDLMELTPQERQAVDRILAERAAVMDRIVADNLPKLLKFQGLRQDDTPRERMQALTEIARAMQPLQEYNSKHGSLLAQLSGVIAPEKAEAMRKMVTEYRGALLAEADATEPQNPRHDTPEKRQAALRGREQLLAIGAELRRSYERQVAARVAELDTMTASLNATPEQETQIRNFVTDFAQQAAAGKPTPEQRRALLQKVLGVLDDDQKLRLFEQLYRQHAPATGGK